MREWLRRAWPHALGVLMVLHGLAHGVLPLRAAGLLDGDSWTYALTVASYTAAIVGFVAAGAGALGIRPFRRFTWWLALVSAIGSLVAFRMLGDLDLWPGMLLDVTLPAAAAFLVTLPRRQNPPRTPARRLLHVAWQATGVLFVAYVAAATVLWPWHRHWGTTPAERVMALPGDPYERQLAFELMHGVSIDAPPDAVWPWVVQLGQDRAGFYSYDWLERLFGVDIRNVDEIRPEWQQRRGGDFVRAAQPGYLGGWLGEDLGWYIAEVQPNRALVLHYWGAFVLLDDGRGGTRLLVRSTISQPRIPVWAAAVSFTAFELPHFIMERRMLLGIKERAERERPIPAARDLH